MASSPITSCLIDGKKVETVMTDFTFLGAKITVDSDCSQEIKRYLLLERKAVTNLGSVLKSRHQKNKQTKKKTNKKNQRRHFANKGPLVKAMVFLLEKHTSHMYGCESWTINKVEQN